MNYLDAFLFVLITMCLAGIHMQFKINALTSRIEELERHSSFKNF